MNRTKQALLAGAGVLTIGAAGLGLSATTSALSGTSSSADPQSSLIDKLVSKFNLKRSDVQAVFDADHASHDKEMKTARETALKKALSSGKITQTQYDHIIGVWKQVDSLMSQAKSETNRTKVHDLLDSLRSWMQKQNINQSVMGQPPRGPGGPGGDNSQSSSSSSS